MKIPKYIYSLIKMQRIEVAPISEQSAEGGVYGYVFRIYRLSNTQYLGTLQREAERVVAWANREYAEAALLLHYNSFIVHKTPFFTFTDKEHRKPYYKRDYVLVTITDPVAQHLEKLIAEVRKSL